MGKLKLSPTFRNEVDFTRTKSLSFVPDFRVDRITRNLQIIMNDQGVAVRRIKYHTHNRHYYAVLRDQRFMVVSFIGADPSGANSAYKASFIADELKTYDLLDQELPFKGN